MTQQFGKTWWGAQWLNALKNIDYSNRLARGSSYARKGAVREILFHENQIHAKVAGTRPKPYHITISLPLFSTVKQDKFIAQLSCKPAIISKLLNHDLDPAVLIIAQQNGLQIFPQQWNDLHMHCSCPDWAVPCKHLAAVIYKVCAEIDNNPFLVFTLRNIDLLAKLNQQGLQLSENSLEIPSLAELYLAKNKQKIATTYDSKQAYIKLAYRSLTPLDKALTSLLAENPVFYSQKSNFKDQYTTNWQKIINKAQKILQTKLSLAEILNASADKTPLNVYQQAHIELDKNFYATVILENNSHSLTQFMLKLENISSNRIDDYQPSIAVLHTVFHLALHLIANGAAIPQIVRQADNCYSIRWLPAMLSKAVAALMEKLANSLPTEILHYQDTENNQLLSSSSVINLVSLFLTELMTILVVKRFDDTFLQLFFNHIAYGFDQAGEESLSTGIYVWLQKYYLSFGKHRPQIIVSETNQDSFMVDVNILNTENLLANPVSLKNILRLKKYQPQRFEVLQVVAQLMEFIPGLEHYINAQGQEPLEMDLESFSQFIFQLIPVIQLLNIDVLLPKALQQILKPKASIHIKTKASSGRGFIRLDQLLDFDWQIAIGEQLISEKEFNQLLKQSNSLIKYKNNYIYISQAELEKLYKHLNNKPRLNSLEILRIALSGDYLGATVSLATQAKKLITQLGASSEIALPQGLQAKLRPYQHRGYSWLYHNAQMGFGAVLADDMGLGKTLQVITTLLKYKQEGLLESKKILIVMPTGLLANWQSELERFAPTLKVQIFHGASRSIKADTDIVLSSYGIVRTDTAKLKKITWQSLIIDEAQNIKNYNSQQAKAIKSIQADNFIAMSGTPVENRLSELWSIVDYSNRGLLGSHKEFIDNYSIPIETYHDQNTIEKLKRISAPFMLRRLKTDKSIISDLPEKIEIDCFACLLEQQASLYQQTLNVAMKKLDAMDGTNKKDLFTRQGIVLQMILALKQICNHPTQFLKNQLYDASLSGKLNLLFNKLDSIIDSGEKVLIFTQFKEMGAMLTQFIDERYNSNTLFYHGGCSLKIRQQIVDKFQHNSGYKVLVLSLKAAGTGLNLTAANHVIHYDLWWNPAVEAQATDRAYRIGQQKNVMVHRFITKNTFEERINEMLQAKKSLAQMTVATGENWIGNLSNKELQEIFTIKN